jgi:hypothetical protein
MAARRHRVLVVANRTATTPALLQEVERRARERATTFTLLIPDPPRSDHADWSPDVALALLERAAGGRVAMLRGGGEEPFEVVSRVVDEGDYDEIIISTLPPRFSRWLKRDLPRRVEELGLPVSVLTLDERGRLREDTIPPMGPIRVD